VIFSVGGTAAMRSNSSCGAAALVLALALLPPGAMAQDKATDKPTATITAKAEPPATAASSEAQTEAKRITAHPFAAMAGSWAGGGTITVTGGAKEKLRCRAHHTANPGAKSLSLSIRCASDSYKFELTSSVLENRGEIAGNWNEAGFGISGSITGQIHGNQIAGVAEAAGYSAEIAMTTNGDRQSVSITPHNVFITGVQIVLARR
jgi:hypothetical protein